MKIVLFTPALKVSAIGRMTSRIAGELIRLGHDIVVVRSEEKCLFDEAMHDFGVSPVDWDDGEAVDRVIRGADVIIYQIGDNYSFHQGCVEWLARAPGVICLHDFFVGHLFLGWAQNHALEANHVLERWYGLKASETFFKAATNGNFVEETHESFPMTEWICAMATGVITHSHWGLPRVMGSCAGPVQVVPLAYDFGNHSDLDAELVDPRDDGLTEILTVGHINPNKRVASVIKAIGSSPTLRRHSRYRVVGRVQGHVTHELASLARNVEVRLRIYGEVDSWTLAKKFQSADIVCCLRWPSLEAASASAIEAMMHGKAIVVTNTGFYSELPDDCVVKVDPANEMTELREALERMAFDADFRQRLGARARTWSSSVFTASNYAKRVVEMGEIAAKGEALIVALRGFANVLERWGARGIDIGEILQPLQIFKGATRS